MPAPRWLRHFRLLPLLGCLSACSPSIDSVSVQSGNDVSVVNVQARIRGGSLVDLDQPTLSVAVAGANPAFVNAGPLPNVGGFDYRRDNLAFAEGQYRLRVTVPYQVLLLPGTRQITREQDFAISPPAGCFFFDRGAANWTADGFFEIVSSGPQDDGTRNDICAGQAPFVVSGPNFPQAFTSVLPASFGSLAVSLGSSCFANPQPAPQNGLIAFDLVSPDLTSVAGWNTATGYELRAAPFASVSPQNPPKMQLIFIDENGQARPELDASGNRVFHDLGAGFQPFAMTRPGFQVRTLRVRVFVPPGAHTGDEVIAVDRVCPRT